MRIKKIIFKNYRQLRDTEIIFEKKTDHDLHIVIGKNGTGKTNILNAVNWCFYNDEPNLTIEQQKLPILNRNEINEVESNGGYKEVNIEIHMESNSTDYIFKRTAGFRVYKNEISGKNKASLDGNNFVIEAIHKNEKGSNILTYEGRRAEDFMEQLIPKSVRDFYFFDGERLDNYFKEATSENIKHSIFILSQIELLERVEKRINIISRDFQNEASDRDPYIEKIKKEVDKCQNDIEILDKEIKECSIEIKNAKDEISNCNEKLKGLPDTNKLQLRREEIKKLLKVKNERLIEKNKNKTDLLFFEGIKIMLYPTIKSTIAIIVDKKAKNEIPPNISNELLEEITVKGYCTVCGRSLDSESLNKINKLITEKRSISIVGHKLQDIDNYLHIFCNNLRFYLNNTNGITNDIKDLNKDIESINNEITDIDKKLSGYNIENINQLIGNRKIFESLFTSKTENLGVLKNRKNRTFISLGLFEKQLETELKKQSKTLSVTKKIILCNKLLEIVKKSKANLIGSTRKEIGEKTKEIFLKLLWKKEDFQDVFIDENYMMILTDLFGNPCLGAISRAEKLLLSLSFTYALHQVSGFNSSFVIDTPVSPTDDLNRENLGKTFSDISLDKQLILLFIPTEYSIEISKTLDVVAANKFFTNFSMETRDTKLEAIR